MPEVIVIGAGLSGLAAAWALQRNGRDVLVLEAAAEPGGHVRTLNHEGFLLENGPSGFQGSAENLWRLVEELNLHSEVERAAPDNRQRYVLRDHRLALMPNQPWSFVRTPLLSWPGKARLLLEPLIPGHAACHETAQAFFQRRFGAEAAAYVAGPFITGIYAGDPNQLGARAAFSKFWSFEKESGSMILGACRHFHRKRKRLAAEGRRPAGSGLFSFQHGLGTLTQRLAANLGRRMLCLHTVHRIQSLEKGYQVSGLGFVMHARQLILAVPPAAAAALLQETAPVARPLLASVPLAPVTVAHWILPRPSPLPSGFGFLTSRGNGMRVLGTIFRSHVFPGCAPEKHLLLASFYGGMLDPAAADLADCELENVVREEHARIAGQPLPQARVLRILRHPAAIPQLLPDHPEKMAAVDQALKALSGIRLAGNYLTGVGMEQAAANGARAAQELMEERSGP